MEAVLLHSAHCTITPQCAGVSCLPEPYNTKYGSVADIRRDWLTNQNTDCCFVVIGLVGRQSHSPLLQLKIDPLRQMGPPY